MATQNPYHNEAVPLHKRIAAGEKLDGTSLKGQGSQQQKQGGQVQKKNK